MKELKMTHIVQFAIPNPLIIARPSWACLKEHLSGLLCCQKRSFTAASEESYLV